MKKILFPMLAALAVLPVSFALAQGDQPRGDRPPGGPGGPGGPGRPQPPKFEDLDADKNGEVSQEEFVAFQVKQAEERAKRGFEMADANKDGKLSKEEMANLGPRRPEGDRRPGGPGAPDGERRRPAPEGDKN